MNYEHATGEVVKIDTFEIARLEALCLADPQHKYRFCAHLSPADGVQEMIIAHTDETIVPIHKHHAKVESFHFIKGFADVVLYHDDGTERETIHMGPFGTGRVVYYRLNADIYHTLRVISPVVVFHETTTGPWHYEDLIIAPWWYAPKGWSR